jgi:tyrosyl-tRNA synthetase
LDTVKRLELAKRYCEEIVTEEELKSLLEAHSSPKAYWGFECSGQ